MALIDFKVKLTVDKTPSDPWWKISHAAADASDLSLRQGFSTAANAIEVNTKKLRAEIKRGRYARAADAFDWKGFEKNLARELESRTMKAAVKSARATAERIGLDPPSNEEIRETVRARARATAKQMAKESRNAMKASLRRLRKDQGLSLKKTTRIGKQIAGLNRKQASGVVTRFNALKDATPRTRNAAIRRQIKAARRTRSSLVARHEGLTSSEDAQEATIRAAAEQGVIKEVWQRWVSIPDKRRDPICKRLHGQRVRLGDKFTDPATGIKYEKPPQPHGVCFPGETLVEFGEVLAAIRRRYDGELVIFRTRAGKNLSCTPNHPILTNGGFVPASALNIGSRVICGGQNVAAFVGDNDQDVPTTIEDVWKSFFCAGEMVSGEMPITAEDFDGDGTDGDVAVVRTDRQLLDDADNTPSAESTNEAKLVGGRASPRQLFHAGGFLELVRRAVATLASLVSGAHLIRSLRWAHAGPLQELGIALVPCLDVVSGEPQSDRAAVHAEELRDSILRFATEVELDYVISVERKRFSGHVYNLQTRDEIYSANGIIAHNCRCGRQYKFKKVTGPQLRTQGPQLGPQLVVSPSVPNPEA